MEVMIILEKPLRFNARLNGGYKASTKKTKKTKKQKNKKRVFSPQKQSSCSQKMMYRAKLGSPTPSISLGLDLSGTQCYGLISGKHRMRPFFCLFFYFNLITTSTHWVCRNRAWRLYPKAVVSAPPHCTLSWGRSNNNYLDFFLYYL